MTPPHPDALSHTFASIRTKAKVAPDIHMHSLRHFHATVLDPVISEAQKQARLGWSTVKMARHYTDSVPKRIAVPQITLAACSRRLRMSQNGRASRVSVSCLARRGVGQGRFFRWRQWQPG